MSQQSGDGVYSTKRLEWTKVLVVPASLAILTLGFNYFASARSSYQAERELKARYVEIATAIMSQPVAEGASESEKEADLALRGWATDTLMQSSPVLIPSDVEEALRRGETTLEVGAARVSLFGDTVEEDNGSREGNYRDADLTRAEFAGLDLSFGDFRNAILVEANMQSADLTRAKLGAANLERVDLRGANLEGTDFTGANMVEAKLEGAIFSSGTILDGVDLSGATWAGVNFDRVQCDESTMWPQDLPETRRPIYCS